MTYRLGHHSTSDDSSAYRPVSEVKFWDESDQPITRLQRYLEKKGWLNAEEEKNYAKQIKKEILAAFDRAEKRPKPPVTEMFADVYDQMPPRLEKQLKSMKEHVEKYKSEYPLDAHEKL